MEDGEGGMEGEGVTGDDVKEREGEKGGEVTGGKDVEKKENGIQQQQQKEKTTKQSKPFYPHTRSIKKTFSL